MHFQNAVLIHVSNHVITVGTVLEIERVTEKIAAIRVANGTDDRVCEGAKRSGQDHGWVNGVSFPVPTPLLLKNATGLAGFSEYLTFQEYLVLVKAV